MIIFTPLFSGLLNTPYDMEKFINPFTDFGFKKLFGEEVNKDLLIDFLNELLKGKQVIKGLTYLKNEHLPSSTEDHKAIFDLYCENEHGEKFIVELQKAQQEFFKDSSIYYATFPIQEQAQTGYWNFELKTVYTIAIMDFVFDEKDPTFHHQVQLVDLSTQTIFYDKLHFIYLEMPKFNKTEQQLQNRYDKWMFILKNLGQLQHRPIALQERIFQKLLNAAEIAQFNPTEQLAYRNTLKYLRDLKNSLDTSYAEGKLEGKIDMVIKLIKEGSLSLEKIAVVTKLSLEEVQQIAQNKEF